MNLMDDLAVNERVTIPAQHLRVSFARSGGPGGQNVNKVESKVELRWAPGESTALVGLSPGDREWLLGRLAPKLTATGDLVVTSSQTRDQLKNRQDARAKLAEIVRKALLRPKKRKKTKPSRSAVEKRIQQKKERSRVKKERRNDDS
jgi:ribosome-associated protein